MNFITLKELKKMVPVASEFKRVPGLKKILEDGIEVILRKQMENHAEIVVYKNGYVSYHAHERYTVFALHNCTYYYYESQGNEHQTIPHNHLRIWNGISVLCWRERIDLCVILKHGKVKLFRMQWM